MDLMSVCRLCLSESVEIFDIFCDAENPICTFSDLVQDIAHVPVDPDDSLSKNICSTCRESCNEYFKFRELIVSSNNYQVMMIKNESVEELDLIVVQHEELVEDVKSQVEDEYQLSVGTSSTDQYAFVEELAEEVETTDFIAIESESSEESGEEQVAIQEEDPREAAVSYHCHKCSKSFNRESKLHEHEKTHSPKARQYPCKTCKRKFTTEDLLTRHEIVHTDMITQIKHETCPRCIVCEVKFNEKSQLEDHIREHKATLESEPIQCMHCEKLFSKFNNLIRHLKTHEENKTHLCTLCSKTFAMGQDLIDHLNRHKGFTPHFCHICNKSYLQLSKLKNHLRSHDNDKVRFW